MNKHTMCEYLNENNEWTYFAVYKNTTNEQVLQKYAKDHGFEEEDIQIVSNGGESYLNDEVRAYSIIIETI